MVSLKIDQNPELASLDLNKNGLLEVQDLSGPLTEEQQGAVGKFISGLINPQSFEAACAFLRELGTVKPQNAWHIKKAAKFSPLAELDVEKSRVRFGGYGFQVNVTGDKPTPLEFSRIAFVLAQNWEYLPLLTGVRGPKGEIWEQPLNFRLASTEEIAQLKKDRADFEFGALYFPDKNEILLGRNPEIGDVIHELNHAIDDFMLAKRVHDSSHASASESHGVKKEDFYKICLSFSKPELEHFKRLYDLTQQRTLTDEEREKYQVYRDRIGETDLFSPFQCFDSEMVAYSHYFTGAAERLDYFEFVERFVSLNSLYGVPITDEQQLHEVRKLTHRLDQRSLKAIERFFEFGDRVLSNPHAAGVAKGEVKRQVLSLASSPQEQIALLAIAHMRRNVFQNASLPSEEKEWFMKSTIRILDSNPPPSEKIKHALLEVLEVYWKFCNANASRPGLSMKERSDEISGFFNSFTHFKLSAIDPIFKILSDFFINAPEVAEIKSSVFCKILLYVWNCDAETWKAMTQVLVRSFMANPQIPLAEKQKALGAAWNIYSEKSETNNRADYFFQALLAEPTVSEEAKALVIGMAFIRIGSTFERLSPEMDKMYSRVSSFTKSDRFRYVGELVAGFFSNPQASPELKRKCLEAVDRLGLYQARKQAERANLRNPSVWRTPASLVECWSSSPLEFQTVTRVLKAVFASADAQGIVPKNFMEFLGGAGTEAAQPYTLELFASIMQSLGVHSPEFQAVLVQKVVAGILSLNADAQLEAFKKVFMPAGILSPELKARYERELTAYSPDVRSGALIWAILKDDSIDTGTRLSLAQALKADVKRPKYLNPEEFLSQVDAVIEKLSQPAIPR